MVDINLLPEEMRKKEEQEKKEAEKRPPVFEVKLSAPKEAKKEESRGKIGIFSSVFKREEKPLPQPKMSPLEKTSEEKKLAPQTQKVIVAKQKPIEEKIQSIKKEEIHVAPASGKPKPKEPPPKEEKIQEKPLMKKEIIFERAALPLAVKKKRGFFAWLKSLFARRKKEKTILPVPEKKPFAPKAADISVEPIPVMVKPPALELKKEIQKPAKAPAPLAPSKPSKLVMPKSLPKNGAKERIVEQPVSTLKINLIPQELILHPELNIGKRLAGILIAAILSGAVIFGWYEYVLWRGRDIAKQNDALQEQIDVIKKDILTYDKERQDVEALIKSLSTMESLLNRHVHWTKVFEQLEKYTIDDVYFSNFAASRDGSLRLSALGKDYASVARQLVTFQSARNFVSKVEINSASAQTEKDAGGKPIIIGTSFDVNIELVPDIFYAKYE